MRRGSSNKVVEQRSSSSNTTAPTDTPSGSEPAYGVLFSPAHFLPLPVCPQQPLNEKTEPGCSQNPEIPATMPPQVRCYNQHRNPADMSSHTHNLHTHLQPTATCPHSTDANSWCCFTVPVKPIDGPKAYETGEYFLPLLSLFLS